MFYSRAARNQLGHFDERLDKWYKESSHHNIMDHLIGNREDMISGDIDFMRFFNTNNFTFRFRGE